MATKKNTKAPAVKHIGLVKNDGWLEPYEEAIRGRHDHAQWKLNDLTQNGKMTLSDFADGYLYFGLHKQDKGWVLREWAPNATEIYVVGDFNDWDKFSHPLKRLDNGVWEIELEGTVCWAVPRVPTRTSSPSSPTAPATTCATPSTPRSCSANSAGSPVSSSRRASKKLSAGTSATRNGWTM